MTSPASLYRVASTVAPSDISDLGYIQTRKNLHDSETEILFDIKPFSEAVKSDPRKWFLVEQVKQIGNSAFWGNDCICECTSRHGWRLNIIAEPANVGDEVFGFLVYKVDSHQKVLHIQYIAVAEKHRRRKIGSKLIKALQQYATKTLTRACVDKVVCAVVPEAVEFYQKHCFKKGKRIVPGQEEAAGETLPDGRVQIQIPLQYHMEWRVPAKKRR